MAEFKNAFIFVSDALSYEEVPEQLVEEAESDAIRTLAPSMHSPKSFASLLTGLEVTNHEVYHFGDKLEQDHVLEMFENSNLFDDDRSGVRYMLGLGEENPELTEMEEPFFWVERALETHLPYGYCDTHGEEDEKESAEGEPLKGKSREEIQEEYRDAARKSFRHFKRHVEELKEMGVYEDTLVIFTADHGELLGQRVSGRRRYRHVKPASRPLAEVPTVFYNYEIEADRMRTVDILPTALDLLDKEWMMETDGESILKELPTQGKCPTGPYIFELDWHWDEKKKRWSMDRKSMLKGIFEDHCPEKVMTALGLNSHEIRFGKNRTDTGEYHDE